MALRRAAGLGTIQARGERWVELRDEALRVKMCRLYGLGAEEFGGPSPSPQPSPTPG
ncbi:MAG: hypothetical protein IIA64_08790 [Planctomycetes bacterium]|nr:hypothetical protein [Planctomycetota bacterium]